MARIKITFSLDLLTLPQRIERRIGIARQGCANLIEINAKQQIRAVNAVASGDLLASVRELSRTPTIVKVGSDRLQARFVEHGRGPGPVPAWSKFEPILKAWAANKGISMRGSLYPIALKIRREGFKGRFPFKRAARISEPQCVSIFNHQLQGL